MPSVLLVDDDPVVHAVYSVLFADKGYHVYSAEDGEAGLQAVRKNRPDAVLLDLTMPRLNGLEWIKTIRADERFKTLPIVVFSAGAVSWQVTAAKNTDAMFVISKNNVDQNKVVETVAMAIKTGNWQIEYGPGLSRRTAERGPPAIERRADPGVMRRFS